MWRTARSLEFHPARQDAKKGLLPPRLSPAAGLVSTKQLKFSVRRIDGFACIAETTSARETKSVEKLSMVLAREHLSAV